MKIEDLIDPVMLKRIKEKSIDEIARELCSVQPMKSVKLPVGDKS